MVDGGSSMASRVETNGGKGGARQFRTAASPWLLLFIVCAFSADAQPLRFTARVDPKQYRIGDWIDVQVNGVVEAAVDSIRPALQDSLGPYEVITVQRSGPDLAWLVRLSTTDSGSAVIPPIPFTYRIKGDTTLRTAYTNSLTVSVGGLPINPEGEIKDIKPPLSAPWKFEDFVPYLIGLVVIVAAGAGYYLYRRRRRKQFDLLAGVQPDIPPHREALTALRILEDKKLWQQGKVKEYYSEVTEIIRRFFERRWNIIALELTSQEILQRLQPIPDTRPVWTPMQSFFLTADLVKFAKYQPAPADHEQELRWAYEIVRAMVPPEPVVAQAARQEATADVR